MAFFPRTLLMAFLSLAPIGGMAVSGDAPSVPFADEMIYFLMIDRFNDGDSGNNTGGFSGSAARETRETHGYDPVDYSYFQGGDFKGVVDRLEYIRDLGATAIWLTPVFKNKTVSSGSAGYHGYWVLDFTDTDPHFGDKEEFRELVRAAHAKGLKVYLDIVVNHTADVIQYADGDYGFLPDARHPPLIPPENGEIKKPLWLNDPAFYHNQGGYMDDNPGHPLYGQSSLRGDFFGLDDLATENPAVIRGMTDIFSRWIREYGVDGFRLDTAKHVHKAFWREFIPAMRRTALEAGKPDFRIFGEVSAEPNVYRGPCNTQRLLGEFMHGAGLPSVLDFGFYRAAVDFTAGGGSPLALRDFFAGDDWYLTPSASAHDLPTFIGNHDFGRIGFEIVKGNPWEPRENWLKRSVLAHALMFFSRGVPIVYYGDEQGFTGKMPGNDKNARQCMFTNTVERYRGEPLIGSDREQGDDHFNPGHPLYRAIRELSGLRKEHPALRRGSQETRLAEERDGLFAFSRVEPDGAVEYVAVFNNSTECREGRVSTSYPVGAEFRQIYPPHTDVALLTDGRGALRVSMEGLSARLFMASGRIPRPQQPPSARLELPEPARRVPGHVDESGFRYAERLPVRAVVDSPVPGAAAFYRRVNGGGWRHLGTDRDPPYSVYYDPSALGADDRVSFRVAYESIFHDRAEAETPGIGFEVTENNTSLFCK